MIVFFAIGMTVINFIVVIVGVAILTKMASEIELRNIGEDRKISRTAAELLEYLKEVEKMPNVTVQEGDMSGYNHVTDELTLNKTHIDSKYIHSTFVALHEFGHALQGEKEFKSKLSTTLAFSALLILQAIGVFYFIFLIESKGVFFFLIIAAWYWWLHRILIKIYYEVSANIKMKRMLFKHLHKELSRTDIKLMMKYKNIFFFTYLIPLGLWILSISVLTYLY